MMNYSIISVISILAISNIILALPAISRDTYASGRGVFGATGYMATSSINDPPASKQSPDTAQPYIPNPYGSYYGVPPYTPLPIATSPYIPNPYFYNPYIQYI